MSSRVNEIMDMLYGFTVDDNGNKAKTISILNGYVSTSMIDHSHYLGIKEDGRVNLVTLIREFTSVESLFKLEGGDGLSVMGNDNYVVVSKKEDTDYILIYKIPVRKSDTLGVKLPLFNRGKLSKINLGKIFIDYKMCITDNYVFVIGDVVDDGVVSTRICIVNMETGRVTTNKSLGHRYTGMAVCHGDGDTVWIVGGKDRKGNATPSVEKYVIKSNQAVMFTPLLDRFICWSNVTITYKDKTLYILSDDGIYMLKDWKYSYVGPITEGIQVKDSDIVIDKDVFIYHKKDTKLYMLDNL